MCRSWNRNPSSEKMDKGNMKYARDGDGSLLIWTPPLDLVADSQPVEALAIPYQSRLGGALYAVPAAFLDDSFLLEANAADVEGLLGPSRIFYSDLIEEEDDGGVTLVGQKAPIVLVDLEDEVLQQMREYDPVTDSTAFPAPFSSEKPQAIVSLKDIGDVVKEWIDGLASGRQHFYSAREEPPPSKANPKKSQPKKVTAAALSEQVATLVAQMQLLAAQQQELKDSMGPKDFVTHAGGPVVGPKEAQVSFVAPTAKQGIPKQTLSSLGPPPRTRAQTPLLAAPDVLLEDEPMDPLAGSSQDPAGMTVASALTQQSTAITALVAHLTSGDPLAELATGGGGGGSLSAKGVARRERMQADLASGSSNYFLAVHQQIFKQMFPSSPIPKSESEVISSGASMCSYLEKHGNFKGQKDLALTMWILAHAFDSAGRDDFRACKEFLALLAASLDQAALDGNWSIAYLISLLEEPPSQMMSERQSPLSSLGKPFAGMVPPQWSAVALAYLREMDLLQNKKNETKLPKSPKREDPTPSPKRRPKFPKRPKPQDGAAEK